MQQFSLQLIPFEMSLTKLWGMVQYITIEIITFVLFVIDAFPILQESLKTRESEM